MVVRMGRILSLNNRAVRTDCALVGGDSGGPLFDMAGRVIAIHSRISDSTDANFHVPINTFTETWDRLAKSENWGYTSRRAYVGARGVNHPDGVQLETIEDDSPASKAGLQIGDILLKGNGMKITDTASYRRCVSSIKPGEVITFDVKREDHEISIRVKTEPRRRS